MTTAERVLPERQVFESSPDRMIYNVPEIHTALAEMEQRRGELFCSFNFMAIDIGIIPAEGPVMSFEETKLGNDSQSGYLIIKHDGATRFPLSNSGKAGGLPFDYNPPVQVEGDLREYVGCTDPPRTLSDGPVVVDISGDPRNAAKYDVRQETLAIGNRAVGAFALGKAMKEFSEEPRHPELSLGLLVAAHLEKSGVDWRPREGRAGTKVDRIIAGMREIYIDEVLAPAALRVLDLTDGWRPHVDGIGNRLPLFHLSFSEARGLLTTKIGSTLDSDPLVRAKYEQRRTAHGNFGEFGRHIDVELNNFLANRLGLTDAAA